MYKKTELIYKEDARRIIDSPRSKQQMLNMLDSIPPIEDMLGKIRAEITHDIHKCNNTDMAFGMQHTLDIIDKYKS